MSFIRQIARLVEHKRAFRRFGSKYWILNSEDFLCILDNEYREWAKKINYVMGSKLIPLYLPPEYLYLHFNKKNKKFCLYVENMITEKMVDEICKWFSISSPSIKSRSRYLIKINDPDSTILDKTKEGNIYIESPRIGKNCVKYNRDIYFIKIRSLLHDIYQFGCLDLSNKGIKDMEKIIGLKDLKILGELDLSNNIITEIKCLKNLKNLYELNLENNQITEIKGLENFKINFFDGYNDVDSILNLGNNPIPQGILEKIGDLDEEGNVYSPRSVVEYCYKKNILDKTSIDKLKKILRVSSRFRLDMALDILNIDKKTFDVKILEWSKEFGFIVDGDYLVIKKDKISEFIDALDRQYKSWEKMEKEKDGKI